MLRNDLSPMPPMPRLTLTDSRDERNAWIVWSAFFLTVVAGILIGRGTSVTWQYAGAAQNWLHQAPLYRCDGRGFLYLPQAAILYIPFTFLPNALAEIVWRLLTIGLFAAGAFRLCRTAESTAGVRLFPLVTCLTIPASISAARNGQATLIIAGLMMLAVEELWRERWLRATLLLSLGLAFKPLTLVMLLLVAALYPPMLPRLLAGVGIVAAIPYALGPWQYVNSQYVAFGEMLAAAAHEGGHHPWAHIFGMLQTAGIEIEWRVQTALRAIAAAATLLAGWLARRRLPTARCPVYLFALSACYLMLFNPRTENNTYALVAPAIGLFCAEAFLVRRQPLVAWRIVGMSIGIVGGYEIGRRLAPGVSPVWLAPLMCTFFNVFVLVRLTRELLDRNGAAGQAPAVAIPDKTPDDSRMAERLAA